MIGLNQSSSCNKTETTLLKCKSDSYSCSVWKLRSDFVNSGISFRYNQRKQSNERGISLFELIVSFLIIALLLAIAVPNFSVLERPLNTSSASLRGFFKQARAKAISSTAAYIVTPVSATRITTQVATSCSGVAQVDPDLVLELERGVVMTSTSWSTCFTARGFADTNVVVTLQDEELQTKSIEVFLGGAVGVQ